MRAVASDARREHAERASLLLADVAFLLDDLGHGPLVRMLEDEFATARSF